MSAKFGLMTGLMTAMTLVPAVALGSDERDGVVYDYATVIESRPIVETVRVSTPRQECWREDVVYYRDDDYRRGDGRVGTVLGGVVGGAIGNAVGHEKRNKQVGTIVGAVLGAAVGNALAQGDVRPERYGEYGSEEVCRVRHEYHEEERLVGYRVRYRYNNETFSTRTRTDPGDTIEIRLAVSPVM